MPAFWSGRERRPLALLLVANVVSIAGSMLTVVAVPWFVLQTTGSPARAGLTAFAGTLPVVLAALLGGPLIDRLGYAVSSVASDAVCAAAVAAVPLLHLAGHLSYPALLALVAVGGLFHAPGETAREVLMPRLAERAGTTVARASSAYESASRGARMLGAPLAGVLIAAIGAADVLLLDAATFAVSALLIGFGVRDGGRGDAREAPSDGGRPRTTLADYRAELREGFAFLLRARLLLAIVLMVMVTNALDQAWSSVLLPVDARERLGGSVSLGLVSGTFSAAALTGSVLYGVFGHRLNQRAVYTWGFIVCGFPRTAVGAFVPGLVPLLVVCAVCGLGAGMINPVAGTEMIRLVPDRMRSRVFGAVTSGVLVAVPLGGLLGGLVVQTAGLTTGMAAVSALYLVTTLSPLVLPAFRQWGAGADGTAAEAATEDGTAAGTGTALRRAADAVER